MSVCLALVRHGQARFDTDDYDRLSPLGEQQATLLACWWERHRARPRHLLAGPLQRQLATATLLAQRLGDVPVQVVAGLAEFDHRAIFHAHRPDLCDPAALAAWKTAQADYAQRFAVTWREALLRWQDPARAADYAEPWAAFRARTQAALAHCLAQLQPGDTALAVTSGGVLAVALQEWSGHEVPPFETLQGAFCNTGFTELLRPAWPEVMGVLGQVDATPHLDPEQRTWR